MRIEEIAYNKAIWPTTLGLKEVRLVRARISTENVPFSGLAALLS
jgi:hypothetical protein